ncbi:unnamed protein product, partial [marine sediment metagenome]
SIPLLLNVWCVRINLALHILIKLELLLGYALSAVAKQDLSWILKRSIK